MNHLKDKLSGKARLVCILVCMAVTLIVPMSAQTGAWTSPVVLSTGGQGWEAAAAIDGSGNSVALWDERTTQDQLWSRSRPSAGNWGAVTQGLPGTADNVCFSGRADQQRRIRDSSMERSKRRVDSRSPACFELEFPSASDPRRVKSEFCNEFARRCRDSLDCGRWSEEHQRHGYGRTAACRVSLDGAADSTSGVHLSADHAGIAGNGAVIVTWETFTAVCHKYGCSTEQLRSACRTAKCG